VSDDTEPPAAPLDLAPWVVDGVSDAAIERAENEARRRGLLLAEWVEEAIERALLREKMSGAPVPDAAAPPE
jgi:hypothetical protein